MLDILLKELDAAHQTIKTSEAAKDKLETVDALFQHLKTLFFAHSKPIDGKTFEKTRRAIVTLFTIQPLTEFKPVYEWYTEFTKIYLWQMHLESQRKDHDWRKHAPIFMQVASEMVAINTSVQTKARSLVSTRLFTTHYANLHFCFIRYMQFATDFLIMDDELINKLMKSINGYGYLVTDFASRIKDNPAFENLYMQFAMHAHYSKYISHLKQAEKNGNQFQKLEACSEVSQRLGYLHEGMCELLRALSANNNIKLIEAQTEIISEVMTEVVVQYNKDGKISLGNSIGMMSAEGFDNTLTKEVRANSILARGLMQGLLTEEEAAECDPGYLITEPHRLSDAIEKLARLQSVRAETATMVSFSFLVLINTKKLDQKSTLGLTQSYLNVLTGLDIMRETGG